MYYECNGCQVVMAFASAPPHVCPECGRAGIVFCLLDDQDLADRMMREIECEIAFGWSALEAGEDAGAPALG